MSKKFFGTDGIRGRVGQAPITPDFVLKLGWAAGKILAKEGGGKILIGKDTRISGYMFESALEAGLVSAGVDVGMLGPMPTPAIAYLTRTLSAKAGIVISASHNPYYDNGIKFFSATGTKLSDDIENAIEAMLEQPLDCVESARLGKVVRVSDAAGRYIEYCKSTVPMGFSLAGQRIVVDCANGATYNVANAVFTELGADVISLSADPDGFNINESCGSTAPEVLQRAVISNRADFGIALDGDGDRVLCVDQFGELLDGDQLLYVIAKGQQKLNQSLGGVVGTLMTNMAYEKAIKELGLGFERAAVGDRYVVEAMRKNGWSLGGESSGHIICRDVTTTGDGIVAALQVLWSCDVLEERIDQVCAGVKKYPQHMINVPSENNKACHDNQNIMAAVAECESKMAGNGRVLLRPSGTEPVVRVMVEGQDQNQVLAYAQEIATVVAKELN